MARIDVCDGCGMPADRKEEVGFLGAMYCMTCAETARRYAGLVKSLREEASALYSAKLEEIRSTEAVALLKRRPDQA